MTTELQEQRSLSHPSPSFECSLGDAPPACNLHLIEMSYFHNVSLACWNHADHRLLAMGFPDRWVWEKLWEMRGSAFACAELQVKPIESGPVVLDQLSICPVIQE